MTSQDKKERRKIRAWFIPFYVKNPYQHELANHLSKLSVDVVGRARIKGLYREVLSCLGSDRVVHLHWLPEFDTHWRDVLRSFLFVVRLYILSWLRCRIVWTVHNLYHHEVKSEQTDRWVARHVVAAANKVITHSQSARRQVIKEFKPADHQKVVVIPHGNYINAYENSIAKSEARSQLGIDQQAFLFLFLGNIRPYKGVLELILAFRQIDHVGGTLLVVGKPLNQTLIDEVTAAAGDHPAIKLVFGFVPDSQVQVYMNACDIVVFPYRQILTSGAVVLAMSFGKPCIAPNLGCLAEILNDQGGFLYDLAEENGLKSSLTRAAQSAEKLHVMGQYNLTRAAEWEWSGIAQDTRTCYIN